INEKSQNVLLISVYETCSLPETSIPPCVSSASLLHSKSLRGHRDCFEKCHLIANQKLSHSKVSRSAYEGMKLALSQKLTSIIQFAQNKDSLSSNGCGRRGAKLLCYSQQGERKLLPQSDAQVPRYAPCWDRAKETGLERQTAEEVDLLRASQSEGWISNPLYGVSLLVTKMNTDELHQLNGRLLKQIEKVFEELTAAVQEKDALASELHVRHIAIEQLFKNCAKLPWLHISRASVKASSSNGAAAVE
uniref:Uncharacterized protein n=1 Tax=Cyprinodon variegatus TaxID=28743 RepID=A0A3Q2DTU5_CYPVA